MAGRIKTLVVLVQENRSFDHMLGWMKSLNPEIDGVTGDETNLVNTSDPSSRAVRFSDRSQYVDPDPGHSMQAIYEQVYGTAFVDATTTPITPPGVTAPPMSGFAQQAEKEKPGMSETVMSGFHPRRRARVPRAGARIRGVRPVVRVQPGVDAAQPAVRALGHLARPGEQRLQATHPRPAAAHHLRLAPRAGLLLRHLLPVPALHALLPQPPPAQVRAHQLPPLRPRLQAPLPGGQAAQLRRRRAALLRPRHPPRERRPPLARRRPGPAVRQGGLRGAAVQPAVGGDAPRGHLRRARRVLRPRAHTRRRRAQPRRHRQPCAVLLQVRPARRPRPGDVHLALDRPGDGAAQAGGAAPDVGVRALVHPGHRQEDLRTQELPHQARRVGGHLRLARAHARHAAQGLPSHPARAGQAKVHGCGGERDAVGVPGGAGTARRRAQRRSRTVPGGGRVVSAQAGGGHDGSRRGQILQRRLQGILGRVRTMQGMRRGRMLHPHPQTTTNILILATSPEEKE